MVGKQLESLKVTIKEFMDNILSTNEMDPIGSETILDLIPLVICNYFLIPAITAMIIRDYYIPSGQGSPKYLSQNERTVLYYMLSLVGISCCLAVNYEFNMLPHGKIYINAIYFMALYLILQCFSSEKELEVKLGIITAFYGVALSYISIAMLHFYESSEIPFITYNTGLFIFIIGTASLFIKIVTSGAS